MKPDLLLICPLFPAAMAQLDAAYTVHRYHEAPDKDAFIAKISDRITAAATAGHEGMPVALMGRFPKLKIISCFGVGVDGIDVPAARKLGIAVTNTPDVLTECVADNALALVLATLRRTVFNDKFVRAGNWLKGNAPLAEKVSGSRLGIIGLGRIGRAVARRAAGFRMRIIYNSTSRAPAEIEKELNAEFKTRDEVFEQADFLSLHVPLNAATRGLVGSAELARMKRSAFLINTTRGPVVQEAALIAALERGIIAGAALDVFEREPLIPDGLRRDNVVLAPHLGSASIETRTRMALIAVENAIAFFAGKRPPTVLNPEALTQS